MPVLAYCVTETEPEIRAPRVGVGEAEIKVLHESGLRCFLSDFTDQLPVQGKSNSGPALAFGRVLREIFQQVAVIPFCFPTILSSEAEIADFVREHAAEYRGDLSRLRRSV
ncbi:MAG TPA: GvpL/GvpF family gas vesicle protein, partial [Terriglobales bacterium]|nr:GvpL/GvpF family gas vesicle protein [Terriglobales bacterium]